MNEELRRKLAAILGKGKSAKSNGHAGNDEPIKESAKTNFLINPGPKMRTCKRCGSQKCLDDFYPDRDHTTHRTKSGRPSIVRYHICKICTLEKSKAYQAENAESIAEYRRRRWENNKGSVQEINKRSRDKKRKENPLHFKEKWLAAKYGLDAGTYLRMARDQKECCAVCGNPETAIHNRTLKPKMLAIDHCHDTEKIRGLLCGKCNTMIGLSKDNEATLRAAADYIERWKLIHAEEGCDDGKESEAL